MPIYKKPLLILLVLLAAAGGSMIYGWYGQSAEVVDSASGQETNGRAGHVLTVYVTGAVNKPGVVCVEEGARAADAVNACGGLLPVADRDRINLARPLKDGEQLRIPESRLARREIQPVQQGRRNRIMAWLISIRPEKRNWIPCRGSVRPWQSESLNIGKRKADFSLWKISAK